MGRTVGVELVAEGVESAVPQLPAFGDPGLGGVHGRRLQPAVAHTAALLTPYEPAALEVTQMLLDRRQRHVEWLGELTERCRAAAEPIEHAAPAGVGERLEQAVQLVVGKLKHTLEYVDTVAQKTRVYFSISQLAQTGCPATRQ